MKARSNTIVYKKTEYMLSAYTTDQDVNYMLELVRCSKERTAI